MNNNEIAPINNVYVDLSIVPKNKDGKPMYSNIEEFNALVNKQPSKNWLRVHPYNKKSYIPIGIVEHCLSSIFPFREILQHGEPKMIGNSIVISVQLRVYHPLLGQWLSYAGVGAVPIELEKGAGALEFNKMSRTALHYNVPSALSFAILNAAKKIGKIFGADINRDHTI